MGSSATRYTLAYDGALCSDVLAVFLRAVSVWYRRRARTMGHASGRTGSITVIQRANSDLRLAPHFHSLLLDGVYVGDGMGEPLLFVETPPPSDGEIKRLVEVIAGRVIRLLVRRGVLDDGVDTPDRLSEEEPVLAGLLQASVQGIAATGERAGRRIRRVLSDPTAGQRTGDLCFALCCQGLSGRPSLAGHGSRQAHPTSRLLPARREKGPARANKNSAARVNVDGTCARRQRGRPTPPSQHRSCAATCSAPRSPITACAGSVTTSSCSG
ncbi:MAG: hypothetical protein ABIJ09_02800 [Pseudomonadota bacterium]